MPSSSRPVVVVLAVVWRENRVLLVRRAQPPRAGQWDFPGGRLEWGESLGAAAARELREETGVTGTPGVVLPPLELLEPDERGAPHWHVVAVPVLCAWQAGVPYAADDA